MGKLISKTYGNGVTETISYNIQGWQTGIAVKNGNNNIYSQQLKYYNPSKGTAPLYTGNISEWSTTIANYQTNTYGFEYDKLRRLKNTNNYIGTATTPTAAFTERGITYDKNGNIQTLQRYAQNTASPEDSYMYSYQGNKLASINGTDNGATISGATYTYDSNGNLTQDGLKNLQISYNFLNLPSVVNQASAEIAKYSWFADGSKYNVLDNSNNGYYYIGSLIYASNSGNLQIESTDFAGGRINLVENTSTNALSQDIQYHHKDHLGSIRAITNQGGSVVEQNAYYPFGSRHTFGGTYAQTTNRFKFNGKEEQTTGNLQYLDYGARMYDNKIGRWTTQDPLSEKYYAQSPYNYCVNNPVMFVDPDGEEHRVSYNHRDQTITINAIYYTNKYSLSSLKQALNFFNNRRHDNYNYKGVDYTVKYNLSYIVVSNPEEHINLYENSSSGDKNSFIIVDKIDGTTRNGYVTSGITINGKAIKVIKDNQYDPTTGAHEIGHTLKLVQTNEHSSEGVMTPVNDASRSKELTQENIDNMVNSGYQNWYERLKNYLHDIFSNE